MVRKNTPRGTQLLLYVKDAQPVASEEYPTAKEASPRRLLCLAPISSVQGTQTQNIGVYVCNMCMVESKFLRATARELQSVYLSRHCAREWPHNDGALEVN